MGNVAAKVCSAARSVARGISYVGFHQWVSQPHIRRRLVGALTVGAVLAIATPLSVATLGFGPTGIVAGSLAATWQSAAYGALTPAGGPFAALTSLGMTGGISAITTATGFGLAGAAGCLAAGN